MNRLALIALAPLALATPAFAQPMDPNMPGMVMPKPAANAPTKPVQGHARPKKTRAARAKPASAMTSMPGMAGMAMPADPPASPSAGSMPGMKMPAAGAGAMAGMTMPAAPATPATPDAMANMPGMKGMAMPASGQATADVSEPEIPRSDPPPPALDHAADRFYDPAAMAAARAQLRKEHGGATVSMVMANLAEYQSTPGGGGYRWDGEGWIGGDINRFVVKSEGDGSRREGLGSAEAQGLFSHAIGPYFDLQAGVRQDFAPRGRTYATVGFQGLAPYWFDVSGALFLSTNGELLGRLESTYDLRLTQRWVLQPRAELNFAAQNTAETRTGSGLSNAELGLRLRYEIKREFAPYIGVSWDRKIGKTADYARARGEDIGGAMFVAGIRAWF
jgi:copper resistance protein B